MQFDIFAPSKQNENEIIVENRKQLIVTDEVHSVKVGYISDLHLPNHIDKNASEEDVKLFLKDIANKVVKTKYTIICGDISCDLNIFKLFIRELKAVLAEQMSFSFRNHIFIVLGNHEIYASKKDNYSDIVSEYKRIANSSNIHIVANDLWYEEQPDIYFKNKNILNLSSKALATIDKKALAQKLQQSEFILFGGTGFSQYNINSNALHNIYGPRFDRDSEIKEGKVFETLYKKVTELLPNSRVIIVTHTALNEWMHSVKLHPYYVYLHGHTHSNTSVVKDNIRLFANNQVGYISSDFSVRFFSLKERFDIFAEYSDGIHEITPEEYIQFYFMRWNSILYKKDNLIYMLKKEGYYCFFTRSTKGKLLLLNGGQKKTVNNQSINYYYDNMSLMIQKIKIPLDQYTDYLKELSVWVKSFGGSGTIHGAIVDIDFYCHLYVNPSDGAVTPYYALDIVNKTIYPSIHLLLEERSPNIYERFCLLNTSNNEILSSNSQIKEMPIKYEDTDIYSVSHLLFKMQKLYNNILTVWPNEEKTIKSKTHNFIPAPKNGLLETPYTIECGTVLEDLGDHVKILYNGFIYPTEKKCYINSKGRYIRYNNKFHYLNENYKKRSE